MKKRNVSFYCQNVHVDEDQICFRHFMKCLVRLGLSSLILIVILKMTFTGMILSDTNDATLISVCSFIIILSVIQTVDSLQEKKSSSH